MTTRSRYTTAAAVGGLYTALVIGLVGAESRSYRERLRHDRERLANVPPQLPLASLPLSSPSQSQSQSDLPHNVPPDDEVPLRAPQNLPEPNSPPEPEPEPEPAPASALRNSMPPAENGEPDPSSSAPTRTAPDHPRPAPTPGAIWADSLDLGRLTPAEEARLGAELHGLVLASNPVDPDGDIQRLKRVSGPLIANVARKEVEYKFTVLDSDEVNAFSLPGGYIYVARGLFQLVGEAVEPEQDYALQFALGHEIAHVDLKHALNLVAAGQAAGKAQGVDTLNQLLVPIGLGYPDAQEFAADTWSYQRMTTQLNQTRREALMFLIKLQGFSERNGFRNGRVVPDLKSGLTLVENHYRAHPAAWDRLDRLKARGVRPAAGESPPR
ncbi:Peptidase family M48 [Singulisphaera sp. GP187]|uniref:M48 family metallopeptidase n=1 Tax=Singulisphaera sp. GP187 TaxID=1882752 RepID=UPI000925E647|nr:M48 family metallopeptidase [Singulisphaera sp. GP187]SIO39110.1 Peptidase family M48 [Singulisphaera sp. GP187]